MMVVIKRRQKTNENNDNKSTDRTFQKVLGVCGTRLQQK